MTPRMDPARHPDWTRDEQAVSEIVGTLALIGVAVVTVAGFGLYVATLPQPEPEMVVTLDAKASRGGASWNEGDEAIILRHLGGDALEARDTRIQLEVDGVLTSYAGADLGSGFSDGVLEIGEEWSIKLRVPEGADVRVSVVSQQGRQEATIFMAAPEAVA